jgi:ubiquinone/menaquinone biosynthesis C-methylase UbiE
MDSYASRQAEMEAWYRGLLRDEDAAETQLLADYAPHAATLGTFRGRLIDVGGGAGLAARFLDPSVEYVVVDPSPVWSSEEWSSFSRRFRLGGPSPRIIEAPGEQLLFESASFDSAISFWALNHARRPQQCLSEIARVLRPGGRAYLVLEDTPPSWPELARDGAIRIAARVAGRSRRAAVQLPLARAIAAKLTGKWPVQSDHIRITDQELQRWTAGTMRLRRRSWTGGYRSLEYVKPP